MADAYVKVLKEDNGDIIYPQTVSTAVFTSGGSDVETEMGKYVTAEEIISTSAITPVVSTAMLQDGAVTPNKISFGKYSTTKQQVGTWIDDRPVYRMAYSGTTASAVNETVSIAGLKIGILLRVSGCIMRDDDKIDPIQRICADANMTQYSLGLGDFYNNNNNTCSFLFQHSNSTYHGNSYYLVFEYVEPAS